MSLSCSNGYIYCDISHWFCTLQFWSVKVLFFIFVYATDALGTRVVGDHNTTNNYCIHVQWTHNLLHSKWFLWRWGRDLQPLAIKCHWGWNKLARSLQLNWCRLTITCSLFIAINCDKSQALYSEIHIKQKFLHKQWHRCYRMAIYLQLFIYRYVV